MLFLWHAGRMPCAHVRTDLFPYRRFVAVLKTAHSQLLVSDFARLVRQCHAKTHISPVAAWHQGSSGLEHYLGRRIVDLVTHARGRLIQPSAWLTARVQGGIVTDC